MQKIQRRGVLAAMLSISLLSIFPIFAQQAPAITSFTIGQAVESALRTYPSINVSQEELNAAAAAIDLARTAYLPRVDTITQVNRATRNNVFGVLLPQGVIPSMSGPVLGSNNFGSAWGSATGALVTWEPFDLGLRRASVEAAQASEAHSEAALGRTVFDVSVTTANSYLTLVAAQETVRAAEAGVARAQVLAQAVRAQANAQLRPGADASRAEAELAAARTQLVQTQQAEAVARAFLAQFIGVPPEQIALSAPKLLQLPTEEPVLPLNAARNPIAVEQNALLDQRRAELNILEKSYVPRFFAQGSAYARGTGAQVGGSRLGGLNGLAPHTQNYALGFSVIFPIFELPSICARKAVQSANLRAETARYQQIATDLTARWNAAVAAFDGSRRVAANTPVQVSAAAAANQQASARYQTGLGTIVDVADAQRLLTQAEIDDALARLSVWRGLLGVSAAAGNIQAFLTNASQ